MNMSEQVEVVIKIPKYYLTHPQDYSCLAECVRRGVPLPKGHGDLKDIGKCDRKLFYQQCGGANSLITVKNAFDMLLSLPTILKADKAESEE